MTYQHYFLKRTDEETADHIGLQKLRDKKRKIRVMTGILVLRL